MTALRLITRRVEKPWGRHDLLPAFGHVAEGDDAVGEIWFEDPHGSDAELLIKYLFTSEKLSIQVHPDDAMARRQGHMRGKDEAWLVLEADPGATIGIGLRAPGDRDGLRRAALDGSIEDMIDWRPVKAGDYFYSPAGTVHSIGAGLKLIEIQQNVDLTYRLYDFGRPRELHLDDGIAASDPNPYDAALPPQAEADGRTLLSAGPKFVVERWRGERGGKIPATRREPVWLIPVSGSGSIDATGWEAGSVWRADTDVDVALATDADLLVAYAGDRRR